MSTFKPKFLEGDLMRHVVVMSTTASAGLVAMFLVDFLDLYFISLLGQKELAAAVGFAGAITYLTMSSTIGLMIAMSALAAQRIGRGEPEQARRIATNVVVISISIASIMAAIIWVFAPGFVEALGASGETKTYAVRYLRIVVPSLPIVACGMVCTGLLRAHGDAKRAMNATLAAGAVNAIFDPLLIFGFGLGLDGAAYASVLARFAMLFSALLPVLRHYGGFAPFSSDRFRQDLSPIFRIAAPAVLTNIATPVGAIIVTRAISTYGDGAVAGFAVISRLTPLAFCVVFALSGAVGPIIGQNFGAARYDRVRETLSNGLQFTLLYTLLAWAVLFFANGFLADRFGLDAGGSALLFWYGLGVAPLFFFNGALFVANAAFNNLDRPFWSTMLNWGRNTIGIVPFVVIGAQIGGAPGVIIGHAIGGVFFASLGVWLAYSLVRKYADGQVSNHLNAGKTSLPTRGWR